MGNHWRSVGYAMLMAPNKEETAVNWLPRLRWYDFAHAYSEGYITLHDYIVSACSPFLPMN